MQEDILQFFPSEQLILDRSEGCFQFDTSGKKYLDMESGVWCANLGHNHPDISKLISTYAQKSLHNGYKFRSQEAECLSVELQQLAGFRGGASFFLSSGSEAVNLSISLARKLSGRKKILKIHNSYLSAYGYGRIAEENYNLVTVRCNDLEGIENINFENIAAVVIELGGASLEVVRFPEHLFLDKLIRVAKESKCFIIAEEVTTGMGRLGKWFGFQCYNFLPDIIVAGKALGNGYPISAMIVSQKVKEVFNKNPFVYGQSHQNDPLGCAVGLKVIEILRNLDVINKVEGLGDYFASKLNELKDKYPNKIKDVRAKGLMLAIEFQQSIIGKVIADSLFEEGFIAGFKLNTLRFLPPLIIQPPHIDSLIYNLNKLIKKY